MGVRLLTHLRRQISATSHERSAVADLPAGVKRVQMRAARYGMPAGPALEVFLEASDDNGATWRHVVSFTTDGGDIMRADGVIETHSSVLMSMETSGVKLRTRVVTLGENVDTEIETTATDL